ncbi:hypothetical protein KIN20_019368 [Parelaphostrongylus tenuis]|uniref:Uncharacterized protein n=1 Tax=Parelaphostrongylus tenuis TaxID=148309 RepID=A0AAD5ML01_PARTN|nr:hypothetical protein KIN20_019368 [Parelaphostrongylus tenuis]
MVQGGLVRVSSASQRLLSSYPISALQGKFKCSQKLVEQETHNTKKIIICERHLETLKVKLPTILVNNFCIDPIVTYL